MIDAKFVEAVTNLAIDATQIQQIEAAIGDPGNLAGKLFKIAVPERLKLEDVTNQLVNTLPHPPHRHGTVEMSSAESFIDFCNRMKESSSVLFANPAKNTIRAVFDYHEEVNPGWNAPSEAHEMEAEVKGGPFEPYTAKPRWGRFTATYPFPLHRSWQVWKGNDKKPMSQSEIANFIEDNIADVRDVQNGEGIHSRATKDLVRELGLDVAGRMRLLQAARGLSIQVTEKVGSIVNTQTGETTIHYEQRHEPGEPQGPSELKVPKAFIILLPVFNGTEAFELLVRLRYRRDGSSLKWWYDVYNVDRAMELAFESACTSIRQGTGLPLFYANT